MFSSGARGPWRGAMRFPPEEDGGARFGGIFCWVVGDGVEWGRRGNGLEVGVLVFGMNGIGSDRD